jgi:type II secretory pathway pseudopilin PulG
VSRTSPLRQLRPRKGFTLIEALIALGVATMLLMALFTFFGDFLRRFTHQKDTLSGAHDAQLLVDWLRRDIQLLDGSLSSTPSTTYPQFWSHVVHVPGGKILQLFPRRKTLPDEPFPSTHPASASLLSGTPQARLVLQKILRVENAFAWVVPSPNQEDEPRSLAMNIREDGQLKQVRYVFRPREKGVTRYGPDGSVRTLAAPTLRNFRATPTLEIIHNPRDPSFPPHLVKVWLEVEFDVQADKAARPGAKINPRHQGFTTRLLPFFLNASLNSTWSP